ncbi:hypothetical protein KJ996_04055 [Patescibacteria group bacterium]|nr:hypothetical protein [Patescibacteria group bacterium]
MNKLLHWLPRILAILLIGFFFLMTLDVFSMGNSWQQAALEFLMHNIPTLLLLISLIVAWKKPRFAGVIFVLFAVGTVVFYHTYRVAIVFMIVTGIPLLIGGLFLYEGKQSAGKKTH